MLNNILLFSDATKLAIS